jgi:hypothetical protein
MSQVVVVLLGLLWASILIPGVLRDRRQRSPQNSIDAFERSMGILANDLRLRAPGTSPGAAAGRSVLVVDDTDRFAGRPARLRTLRRRRQVLQALVTLTLLSALAVTVAGPVALPALAASGTGAATYLLVLLRVRAREGDARRTLRHLPPREERPREHRVASGDAVADSPA